MLSSLNFFHENWKIVCANRKIKFSVNITEWEEKNMVDPWYINIHTIKIDGAKITYFLFSTFWVSFPSIARKKNSGKQFPFSIQGNISLRKYFSSVSIFLMVIIKIKLCSAYWKAETLTILKKMCKSKKTLKPR